MKYVYLGGPIAGLTEEEANKWRVEADQRLRDSSLFAARWPVLGSLPQYGVYMASQQYGRLTRDHDRWSITNSDIILMNFSGAKKASIGCSMEIGWADMLRKPIITILPEYEPENPHWHDFITESSSVIVSDLDAALTIIFKF